MKLIPYIILLILFSNFLHGQYLIPESVFGVGGGFVTGSNYSVSLTVGQSVIGSAQTSNFKKDIGFWRPVQILTPVEELEELIPIEYRLDQNYPNPFNPSTTISFAIKERSQVNLVVFNVLGQTVATLVDEELPAGEYEARFYPVNLPSGFYIYRITANEFGQSRKMLFLK